jgi:hypothetical protein
VRPQLRPLGGVQAALEQRPEDRRLDLAPIQLCRLAQELQFVGVEWQDLLVVEQPPVELRHPLDPKVIAHPHRPKQRPHPRYELLGLEDRLSNALRHQLAGQDVDVLGEQREQHFHEERRDLRGREAALLEELGDLREPPGRQFGDRRLALDRPQLFGVGEDQPQQLASVGVGQVGVGELLDAGLIAGEGDVDSIVGDVAGDEDRRVVEVFLVEQQLLVGGVEVRVLAFGLVLPGEAVLVPDIGEAGLAARLGQRLLEAVELAFSVGLNRPLQAKQMAEGVEVRLGDGLLVELDPLPVLDEGADGSGISHSSTGAALSRTPAKYSNRKERKGRKEHSGTAQTNTHRSPPVSV